MKYIIEFTNGKNYVRVYDEKKDGLRKVGKLVFLYNNSIVCRAVYDTEAEAVASYGRHNTRCIILPDGTETTSARYFGNDTPEDVFVPWSDIKRELWPGETD